MKPIPIKLREEMNADKYYSRCCLTGTKSEIVFHHAWQYAKGQINEKWAIMPVTNRKHAFDGDADSIHNCLKTRRKVQYLSLLRADLEDLKCRMSRKNWQQEFNFLKKLNDSNLL